jgi:hypothetical protein
VYFKDADEANDWLEFDAGEYDVENYSFHYPDTFAEWQEWRRVALDNLVESGTLVGHNRKEG